METVLVIAADYRDFQVWMGNTLIYWPGKKKPKVQKKGTGWVINQVEFRYLSDEIMIRGRHGGRYTETDRAHQNNNRWKYKELLEINGIQYVESLV